MTGRRQKTRDKTKALRSWETSKFRFFVIKQNENNLQGAPKK